MPGVALESGAEFSGARQDPGGILGTFDCTEQELNPPIFDAAVPQ